MVVLGQTDEAAAADRTYTVVLKDGKEYHGFVTKRGDRVEILLDTPWKQATREYVRDSQIDYQFPEDAEQRAKRRVEQAAKDGYAPVGDTWVNAVEARLAERARAMIAEVRAEAPNTPASGQEPRVAEPVATAVASPAAPGLLAQWGFHAAIVLVTGTLVALVVKFAIVG